MPLTNPADITAQEQMFRDHLMEFVRPRTPNSRHPQEIVALLKGRFSRRLGITNPEINFFCY